LTNGPSNPLDSFREYSPLRVGVEQKVLAVGDPVSGSASISGFDLGLVVQNHVLQGIMDFQLSVVFDEPQFAEFVHEKADARSGRADHLRQCFLTVLSQDWLRPAFLAEICQEKEKPGEALFARVEQFC
jgi:hypothetical protein